MNFDVLSFIFGKLNCGSNFNDVVSYLLGKAVSAVWKTITNVAIASFTAVSSTLRELVVDITPIQSGGGDPSLTNIRPISGWTGANVVTAKSTPYCQINKSGGFWQGTAGQIESDGATIRRTFNTNSNINTIVPANQVDTFISDTKNLPAGAYTCSADVDISVSGVSVFFVFSDANGNNPIWIANGTTGNIPDGFQLQIIVILKNGERVRFTEADHIYVSNIVVAIAPRIYRITFPVAVGTVYGGTLTDNGDGTWTMTVTQILSQFAWGDGSNPQVGDTYERRTFDNAFSSVVQTNATNCPNNIGVGYNIYTESGNYYIASNGTRVQLYLPVGTSGDLVVQIVGNLATPVSYTLTAESVRALLGQNNIFADCGNINTITYRES